MTCWQPIAPPRAGTRRHFHGVLFSLAALAVLFVSTAPVVAKHRAFTGLVELGRGSHSFSEGTGGCVSPAE